MTVSQKPEKQFRSGKPRYMRLTDEEWAQLEEWAAEVSERLRVPFSASLMVRRLIQEEAERRLRLKADLQAEAMHR